MYFASPIMAEYWATLGVTRQLGLARVKEPQGRRATKWPGQAPRRVLRRACGPHPIFLHPT
jgi:hypothetical protein